MNGLTVPCVKDYHSSNMRASITVPVGNLRSSFMLLIDEVERTFRRTFRVNEGHLALETVVHDDS